MKLSYLKKYSLRAQWRSYLFLAGFLLGTTAGAWAGDVDVKLTTNDGSTQFSVLDSDNAEVGYVDSNGNGYFTTLNQTGSGGNVVLNQNTLQNGATFYVSSGTVSNNLSVGGVLTVGNVLRVGNATAFSDNYIAYPMTAGAAIAAKQVVIMSPMTGQINTTNVASSVTVVGITVTATTGGGQTIYVATSGMVTSVPCAAALSTGQRVCTSTTVGDVGACASATNDAAGIGKMLTTCTAATTGTVLLMSQ